LALAGLLSALGWSGAVRGGAETKSQPRFVDLSLLVASDFPCTWPANFPPFQINHYRRIGPLSAYNIDILAIDENTGTQFDAPAHSIPPPDSGFPNAGPFGKITGDKVPAWQFVGEACVVDCRRLLDTAPRGRSDLVKKEHVMAWEKKHRPVGRAMSSCSPAVTAISSTSPFPPAGALSPSLSRARRPPGRTPTRRAWSTWPGARS
jgi:hypothetical protein